MINIKFLFHFIYFIVFEKLLFDLTAVFCAKSCNYDCSKCKAWHCTPNVKTSLFLFERDYSDYCNKKRCFLK